MDIWDGESAYEVVPAQKLVLQNVDEIFVCSEVGKNYLTKKFPEVKDVFKCSYLGTRDQGKDLEFKSKKEFVIVSCARIEPVKRVDLLVNALCLIKDVEILWIHFGNGSERAKVDEAIKKLPSNICVDMRGTTPHEKVMEFYCNNHVDLFINTSSSEGLPVSIMEANSHGIPAIATDVGGTCEITNSETGILIDKDFSSEELANCILRFVLMDETEYLYRRKATRMYWEQHFSATNNYKQFYEQIIKENDN